jgi:hypothetical protein
MLFWLYYPPIKGNFWGLILAPNYHVSFILLGRVPIWEFCQLSNMITSINYSQTSKTVCKPTGCTVIQIEAKIPTIPWPPVAFVSLGIGVSSMSNNSCGWQDFSPMASEL